MAKFTQDHKKEFSGNYFKEGIYKVKIMLVEFGETQDGKEYAEFTVVGDNEEEGQARVWFTTDAAMNFSFNAIRNIFVHNAPDNKKDDVRKKFDELEDTEQLDKACQTLIGKECWYSVYENPERTYTGSDGKLRHSFDRNVYGYEPTPRTVTPKETKVADSAPVADDGDPGPTDEGGKPFGF